MSAAARARAAGERAARAMREAMAAAIGRELRGISAEVTDTGVAISGRGLVRRVLADGRLRAAAWWLR